MDTSSCSAAPLPPQRAFSGRSLRSQPTPRDTLEDTASSSSDEPLELLLDERTAAMDAEAFVEEGQEEPVVLPQHGSSPPAAVTRLPLERAMSPADAFQEFRCPICLDPFENPVTLPCNHNVCKDHILNLAAASGGAVGDGVPIEVQCPKCRTLAVFPSAHSIPVNVEMQSIMTMLVKMMAQQHAAPAQPPVAPVHSQPTPKGVLKRPGSAGERRVRVMSPQVAMDEEDKIAIQKRKEERLAKAAEAKLADMQRRLEAQRVALARERDQRRQHSDTDVARAHSARDKHAQQPARPVTTGDVDDGTFFAKEKEFLTLQRERDLERERKRIQLEKEMEIEVQMWSERTERLRQDIHSERSPEDTLRAIEEYERRGAAQGSGPALSESQRSPEKSTPRLLSTSQKVWLAEQRAISAHNRGTDPSLAGEGDSTAKPQPDHATPPSTFARRQPDYETLIAIAHVERQFERDAEEQLSRAEMARLAEERARKMVAAYKAPPKYGQPSPQPKRPATGISVPYVPKLEKAKHPVP